MAIKCTSDREYLSSEPQEILDKVCVQAIWKFTAIKMHKKCFISEIIQQQDINSYGKKNTSTKIPRVSQE